jgi:hypothetical protein
MSSFEERGGETRGEERRQEERRGEERRGEERRGDPMEDIDEEHLTGGRIVFLKAMLMETFRLYLYVNILI